MAFEQRVCWIDLLPAEILLIILGYLNDYTDRYHLSLLSERLAGVVLESYKSLRTIESLSLDNYRANSVDFEALEPILKTASKLKILKLSNRYGQNVVKRLGPDANYILANNCPHLASLDVSGVSIAPSELVLIMKKCDGISSLNIVNAKFDDWNEMPIIEHRAFVQIQRNADQLFHGRNSPPDLNSLLSPPGLSVISDSTTKEEFILKRIFAFYDDWLKEDLNEFDQEFEEILWTKILEGRHYSYIATIKKAKINRSFLNEIDKYTRLELSEYDEFDETIWSARGWVYQDNRSQSNKYLRVIVRNVGGRNRTWYHVETMPAKGLFRLTNANLRSIHVEKKEIMTFGLKRISCDFLLRSVVLARENEFSIFGHRNTLKSVSIDDITLDDDCNLNDSQINAIKTSLCNRISLIMGPPGTGKTFTSATLALKLFETSSSRNCKILICGSSNIAVDIIADKIQELGQLKVVRISSEYNMKKQDGNSQPYYLNKLLEERINAEEEHFLSEPYRGFREMLSKERYLSQYERREMNDRKRRCEKQILDESHVICCTCNGVPKLLSYGKYIFDSIIVDECSQISVPEGLLLLQFLPRRIVLVGDDNQLGPVIKDTLKKKYNCSNTVLYNKLKGVGFKPIMLDVQYRMHPEIVRFPNKHFYQGKIKNGIQASDRLWTGYENKCPFPKQDKPIYFHCHNFVESSRDRSTSWINEGEVEVVVATIQILLLRGIQKNEIGVITPYKDQSNLIKDRLKPRDSEGKIIKTKPSTDTIEVDTVDAYQGRDKNYVIVSLVRSKSCSGFISDRKRLNVTLTRAKYGLIIIGNALSLTKNPLLNLLIKDFSSRGLLYSDILSEKSRSFTLDELMMRDHNISAAVSSLMRDLINKLR